MPTQWPGSLGQPSPLDRLKRKPRTDVSTYKHPDIPDVKDEFPNPEAATSSGGEIPHRHQLPVYGLSHRERLQIPEDPLGTVTPAPIIAEQAAREVASGKINESPAAGSEHTIRAGAMALRRTATTQHIKALEVETPQALYSPSAAGSASPMESSCASSSLCVEVPPRPKRDNGEELETFECPYCLEPQRIKTDHAWK